MRGLDAIQAKPSSFSSQPNFRILSVSIPGLGLQTIGRRLDKNSTAPGFYMSTSKGNTVSPVPMPHAVLRRSITRTRLPKTLLRIPIAERKLLPQRQVADIIRFSNWPAEALGYRGVVFGRSAFLLRCSLLPGFFRFLRAAERFIRTCGARSRLYNAATGCKNCRVLVLSPFADLRCPDENGSNTSPLHEQWHRQASLGVRADTSRAMPVATPPSARVHSVRRECAGQQIPADSCSGVDRVPVAIVHRPCTFIRPLAAVLLCRAPGKPGGAWCWCKLPAILRISSMPDGTGRGPGDPLPLCRHDHHRVAAFVKRPMAGVAHCRGRPAADHNLADVAGNPCPINGTAAGLTVEGVSIDIVDDETLPTLNVSLVYEQGDETVSEGASRNATGPCC